MKNIIKTIFVVHILFISALANLNAEQITGIIYGKDENSKPMPLNKARITLLPSLTGVLTGINGHFEITPKTNDTAFIVSFVGYTPDTIAIYGYTSNTEIHLKNIQLQGIEVGGNKYASQLNFSDGIRTEVISSRGLLKAACCNLSESFTTTPSVDVQYTDAVTGAKRIQLLGLQSVYSQIQAENTPSLRGLASSYGFAYIPGQWLEGISISKGASTVKNGFESIAGLINIDYKKPESQNPTTLNFYVNDMAHLEFNADHTINFNDIDGTTFFLHGNYSNLMEIDHNKDNFLDKPLGYQINFMNRWDNNITDNWENRTRYNIMIDEKKGGQMGYWDKATSPYNNKDSEKWGMYNKNMLYNINTRNGFILNDKGMNIGTILNFNYHNQKSFFGRRNFNGEQSSFYTNIMYQLPIDTTTHSHTDDKEHNMFCNSTLTTGVSVQYDNYIGEIDNLNSLLPNDNNSNILIPGLFAEYTFSLIENLKAILGMRVDFAMSKTTMPFENIVYENQKTLLTPRLHLKYAPIEEILVFGASIGKGYRIPRAIEENTGYLASSRNFYIDGNLNPEDALNYGVNAFWTFEFANIPFDIKLDYYHTDFFEQMVVDLDKYPNYVFFYNLTSVNGKSYSNAFQIDATIQPIKNFFITAAYRMNDVKITTDDKLQDKSLQSKHKAFLNFQYNTEMNEWAFDLTFDYNGSGRMPKQIINETPLYEKYNPFLLINAQITKQFGDFDIYLGAENITNYMIPNAIKAANKPFSNLFDASMIYGPIAGRGVYFGIRYKIF